MDRYTNHLNRVIENANTLSKHLGITYIGSEHLIEAMLSVPECKACQIMTACNITEPGFSRYVQGSVDTACTISGYTPRTKRIFANAAELASRYAGRESLVGTEHVLAAILQESDSLAVRIFHALRINYTALLARTISAIRNVGQSGIHIQYEIHDTDDDDDDETDDGPAQSVNDPFEFRRRMEEEMRQRMMSERDRYNAERRPDGREGYGRSSALSRYGTDLTQKAKDGKIDPVIGRKKEIDEVIQILSRRTKNNPVLIGEPGVGKSAVVEGLAQAIVSGDVPDLLKNKTVFQLDLAGMLAGTKYRGEFEERLKDAMNALQSDGNTILFIDEIHQIVGAGATSDGSMDAGNILKPMLARGEIQTIGATTLDEYRKYIEKDRALDRRFNKIIVEEPTVEDTVEILRGLRDKYEEHHKVEITDDAIIAAATLSDRYITDRFLPDKAIDLIDEAASRAKLDSYNAPPEINDIQAQIDRLQLEKEKAIRDEDYSGADVAKKKIDELTEKLASHNAALVGGGDKSVSITSENIAALISNKTGVPVVKLNEAESEKLLHLEENLHKRIIGQDEAVSAVSRAIRRARAGLNSPNKPIGSFIFVGPTGVGKTDLAKALAEAMFGDERQMIRIDMSEYMEKHNVSKLIGAPPGYVGYDDSDGQLTEKVRTKPYSVVLFDEIEKAHPDVFNVLLQILDDGRLTDNKGRTINFKNTIIIMTSNVGASQIQSAKAFGFSEGGAQSDYETMKDSINEALKNQFRPEFLNRLDDVIVFKKLTQEEVGQICYKIIDQLQKRLDARGIKLNVTKDAVSLLVEKGYDEANGARPLQRTVQRLVEDRLSDEILAGNILDGEEVTVYVADGGLKFKSEKKEN
ncbi:MAG: ATP-dependent Clp protease ATP-binding subunit [Clostridia bacterium]|nr:ATP-dependent Clp protease ATP-binding subunit [Clostridia bacterium]